MTPLDESTIHAALGDLPGWAFDDDSLTRTYRVENFRAAMALLIRIGFEAEERNHHPEIFNVYSTVRITLRTHDAGDKVTQADLDLARVIEALPR